MKSLRGLSFKPMGFLVITAVLLQWRCIEFYAINKMELSRSKQHTFILANTSLKCVVKSLHYQCSTYKRKNKTIDSRSIYRIWRIKMGFCSLNGLPMKELSHLVINLWWSGRNTQNIICKTVIIAQPKNVINYSLKYYSLSKKRSYLIIFKINCIHTDTASYPKYYKTQCQYMKRNDCYWFAVYAYNKYVII